MTEYDPTTEPDPAPLEAEPPHWSLWLFYLYFRPAAFFRNFVVRPVPILGIIAGWSVGIVSMADRIETRLATSGAGGTESIYTIFAADWPIFWVSCLTVGAAAGFIYYHLGGWWYRKRLEFSEGTPGPDAALPTRVYIFSFQAYTIPSILYLAWMTYRYDSPLAAFRGSDPWGMVVIVALLWSVVVSYRGVVTLFDVRRWKALLWFLILPIVVYSFFLVAVGIFLFAIPGALSEVPEISNPVTVNREGFTLQHPANWSVMTSDEDYDPDYQFMIEPPWSDAIVRFIIYDFPIDPQFEAEMTLDNFATDYDIFDVEEIALWGDHDGSGYRAIAEIENGRYVLVCFAATGEHRSFEILELAEEPTRETLEPGFDLIRESFGLVDYPIDFPEEQDTPPEP